MNGGSLRTDGIKLTHLEKEEDRELMPRQVGLVSSIHWTSGSRRERVKLSLPLMSRLARLLGNNQTTTVT
ncbi:hypothetical protein BaRGS_00017822 [Batillaria attramentaria]|uniref:Uncharacterized protein n=1 Tax=Batillaria attramentaria TaxID=370345 RepID=A0ABD0KUV1_9CAEN